MAEAVATEYLRFVETERRAQRLAQAAPGAGEGHVFQPVSVPARQCGELMRVAARRAVGLFRPGKQQEVVWVEGASQLAVGFAGLSVKLATGLLSVNVPVRCDQIGKARVEVLFAVGSPEEPSGLYAATARRPSGPELVVGTWGDALVAFAWQCLLGLVTGIAGATGKDQRGNLLVPVELSVTGRGIQILPMARHRFSGKSSLKSGSKMVRQP